MPIQNLRLDDFTAFEKAELTFCPGINVFIGANSTGKTHALKAMYALLKVCERAHLDKIFQPDRLSDILSDKLVGVFKPDAVGRLVRRRKGGHHKGTISIVYDGLPLTATITTLNNVSLEFERLPNPEPSVYLPVHEFLSTYEGFAAAYLKRETAFDETYFDLSIALNASPLRGTRQAEIDVLVKPLENAIGGKVTQENGRFYVKLPEGKFEAHLVAEGYRKLAGLVYLILNGSLTQNGILFWDEPEAKLNPNQVSVVVKMLKVLADSGIQIFLATHDYLLSQELSMLAEYEPEALNMRFFAFHKPNRRSGVAVEAGDSLVEIEYNPILDEFAAHYDREADLFHRS